MAESRGGLCGADEQTALLKPRDFDRISRLAYERFGLDLREGKQALVASRLGRKVRELNLRSFSEYVRMVTEDTTGEALIGLVNALTTNFTCFLREPAHFDFLANAIWPTLRQRQQAKLWSAGCATGEEPYSILFSLLDQPGVSGGLSVLATDISTAALATARSAVYSCECVRTLPPAWRKRYFLRGDGDWTGQCRVRPEIRRMTEFRRLNLIEGGPPPGQFPVIFCRNVMIYFDKPTQERVVGWLTSALEPGGYLLIGHAESLMGVRHELAYVRPAIYRLPAPRPCSKLRRSD